ncbi:MAG: carbon-nitrogen family hydrolase [Bacillus sp. (in: firmicutes)]
MKVAIYQMGITTGNPSENRKKVESWVHTVCKGGDKPDLLVLPELWTTGYCLEELKSMAEPEGRETLPFVGGLAKHYGVNIVAGSIANQKADGIYNTSFVIDRSGACIRQYDKVHLVPMLREPDYLKGGKSAPVIVEVEGVKIGLIICYDLRFPEIIRNLALEGAQLLLVVAEWPVARRNHWRILQQARAIENQMYVVSCNCVGEHGGVVYAGTSMIVDPWGDIVAEEGIEQEATTIVDLDFKKVDSVRKEVPIFKSRVPDLYR